MWWLFGLINVIIVMLFSWFFYKIVKENNINSIRNKSAITTLLLFAFLSGFIGTLIIGCIFIYLIVDFILYTRK
jgi:hypothetical protein